MINTATYEVNLYLNGRLIGNCRRLAQNLSWTRRRTKVGVDSIDFTINDVLFDQWCRQRSVTINDLLKPLALECRTGGWICGDDAGIFAAAAECEFGTQV